MKKVLVSLAVTLLVLAFAIGAAGAQPAQAAPSAQVSAGWMPFSGGLYDAQTDSVVNINGLVHILARWKTLPSGGAQVDIDTNLSSAYVTVTTDTGVPYRTFGAGQSSIIFPTDPLFPNDPVRTYASSFWLVTVGEDRPLPPNPIFPNDPIRPLRFALQLDLVFSAVGLLDFDASTVYAIPAIIEGP